MSAPQSAFLNEIDPLQKAKEVSYGSLRVLHPFIDEDTMMLVGGRLSKSFEPYVNRHPVIIPGKHVLTKLMVRYEHLRLLHEGLTLVAASLARWYAIIGACRVIREVTCNYL